MTEDGEESQGLSQLIGENLEIYFERNSMVEISNLYSSCLEALERPLLEQVMIYTEHNQTKASKVLGVNRNTLRVKLKKYDMLKQKHR